VFKGSDSGHNCLLKFNRARKPAITSHLKMSLLKPFLFIIVLVFYLPVQTNAFQHVMDASLAGCPLERVKSWLELQSKTLELLDTEVNVANWNYETNITQGGIRRQNRGFWKLTQPVLKKISKRPHALVFHLKPEPWQSRDRLVQSSLDVSTWIPWP